MIGFFGFAPWAAVEAARGRWGITAAVVGVAFMLVSVWSLLHPRLGWVLGTSWGIYGFYVLGYLDLVDKLPKWLMDVDLDITNGIDGAVLGMLVLIGVVLQCLVLVAIPTACSFLVVYWLTTKIASVRGSSVPRTLFPARSSEDRSSRVIA